jgi:hypothetical protein
MCIARGLCKAAATVAIARKLCLASASAARRRVPALDHDDFGLNQSKIIVIDSYKLERDMQISLRNLRKLDCAGKAAQRPTFHYPL